MRRLVAFTSLFGLAAGALFACTNNSSGPGSDVAAICSKFVSCGTLASNGSPYTQSSCLSQFDGWLPGAACTSAVTSASCATLNTETETSVYTTCFPSCPSPGTNVCQGNDVVECYSATDGGVGTATTWACTAVCDATGQTYTGVCGASDEGQSAGAAGQVCFCN